MHSTAGQGAVAVCGTCLYLQGLSLRLPALLLPGLPQAANPGCCLRLRPGSQLGPCFGWGAGASWQQVFCSALHRLSSFMLVHYCHCCLGMNTLNHRHPTLRHCPHPRSTSFAPGLGGWVQPFALDLRLQRYTLGRPLQTAVFHGYELTDVVQLARAPWLPGALTGVSSNGMVALWDLRRCAGQGFVRYTRLLRWWVV